MPIQEEERASGKPAAKARPILRPSTTSNWNFFRWNRENGSTLKWKDTRTLIASRCQNSILNYFDTRKLVEKKMAEFLMVEFLMNARKCHQRTQHHWSDEIKEKLSMAPYWSADKWIDVLSKGGGQKKRFQYCLKPNCPEKLLYFRAIQGRSGKTYSGNARINPALQDNVLLSKDFTKYVHHVGNGKKLRSIVRNGLPGGFSTITTRHAVFFTVVNPMDDEQGSREIFCDLSKARIARYKILGNHFRIRYIGAINSSLKKEDCNFKREDAPMSLGLGRWGNPLLHTPPPPPHSNLQKKDKKEKRKIETKRRKIINDKHKRIGPRPGRRKVGGNGEEEANANPKLVTSLWLR